MPADPSPTTPGQDARGAHLLAICEVLKVVVVERLFRMTKETRLRIPAFAVAYRFAVDWSHRIQGMRSWRMARQVLSRRR